MCYYCRSVLDACNFCPPALNLSLFLSLLLEIGTCPRKRLAAAPPFCPPLTRDCPRTRERGREREHKGGKEGGAEKPKRGTGFHRWTVEGKAEKAKRRRRIQGKRSGNMIPEASPATAKTIALALGGEGLVRNSSQGARAQKGMKHNADSSRASYRKTHESTNREETTKKQSSKNHLLHETEGEISQREDVRAGRGLKSQD